MVFKILNARANALAFFFEGKLIQKKGARIKSLALPCEAYAGGHLVVFIDECLRKNDARHAHTGCFAVSGSHNTGI